MVLSTAAALPQSGTATLEVVDLRSNAVGAQGFRALARLLAGAGCRPRELRLGGSGGQDEGLHELAGALAGTAGERLELLDLSGSLIGSAGAKALAGVSARGFSIGL